MTTVSRHTIASSGAATRSPISNAAVIAPVVAPAPLPVTVDPTVVAVPDVIEEHHDDVTLAPPVVDVPAAPPVVDEPVVLPPEPTTAQSIETVVGETPTALSTTR